MYEPQTTKTVRDTIRDTFTPSRIGLLFWAFSAVFMGTVGLASYQFGAPALNISTSISGIAGLPLPPGGEVTTTASIGPTGSIGDIEVVRLPDRSSGKFDDKLERSQIAVLQDQIVRLRRRLSVLSEQNAAYSRRLAALEQDLGNSDIRNNVQTPHVAAESSARTGNSNPSALSSEIVTSQPTQPYPKPKITLRPAPQMSSDLADGQTGSVSGDEMKQSASDLSVPVRGLPRRISIHSGQQPEIAASSVRSQEPVRIVTLPQPEGTPIVTGSINPEARTPQSSTFDSTPTTTGHQPKIIEPSEAVGRLHGSGKNVLKRSDFGAVVGHYETIAEAAKAWATFKEQNEERMRDLRPLIAERVSLDGGVSLLVGPFGNAADAASACFHLLEVTEYCHPALYAGSPLVVAADFRKTAF